MILSCVAAQLENEGYRNRTNDTFSPNNQKQLVQIAAPPSPDIIVSYLIPQYPNPDPTSNIGTVYNEILLDLPLSENVEVVINVLNNGVSGKTVKAIVAYLTSAIDPTRRAQNVIDLREFVVPNKLCIRSS